MLATDRPLAGFDQCSSAVLQNMQKHTQKQRLKKRSSEILLEGRSAMHTCWHLQKFVLAASNSMQVWGLCCVTRATLNFVCSVTACPVKKNASRHVTCTSFNQQALPFAYLTLGGSWAICKQGYQAVRRGKHQLALLGRRPLLRLPG